MKASHKGGTRSQRRERSCSEGDLGTLPAQPSLQWDHQRAAAARRQAFDLAIRAPIRAAAATVIGAVLSCCGSKYLSQACAKKLAWIIRAAKDQRLSGIPSRRQGGPRRTVYDLPASAEDRGAKLDKHISSRMWEVCGTFRPSATTNVARWCAATSPIAAAGLTYIAVEPLSTMSADSADRRGFRKLNSNLVGARPHKRLRVGFGPGRPKRS